MVKAERILATLLVALAICFEPADLFAQSPDGTFEALELEVVSRKQSQVAASPGEAPSIHDLAERLNLPTRIEAGSQTAATEEGDASNMDDHPLIEMADGSKVRLPIRLGHKLSSDRKTLLQFGDALLRMHPLRTDLFWIDSNGEIATRVQNRFDGQVRLDMSTDGFTAIAGAEYFAARQADNEDQPTPPLIVDLYSPNGKRLWTRELEKGLMVHHLLALPDSQGAVIAVAPRDDPLARNELRIIRDNERQPVEGATTGFGILQKIALIEKESALFIQGSDAYGIVELASGEARWQMPGRIRLVSPVAAESGNERLYLVTGERVSTDSIYRWTLSILDIQSGKPLGQTTIDGDWPGREGKVFESINGDEITVRAGDDLVTVRVKLRR